MQIHELSERKKVDRESKLVYPGDLTMKPDIARQIKKAQADSAARLSQQAKQAAPAAAANPFGQMASSLRSPPTPAGTVTTSTGGTATRTATGTKHTAAAANPNVAAQPAAQSAAQPAAQQAVAPSVASSKKAAPATGWSRIGAIGKAIATGAGHGIAAAAGIDPSTGKAVSSPSYQYQSRSGTAPSAGTPQATLMAKLAPTGLTQKGLAAAGQVLQQLNSGNRRINKTGDRNVDAVLSSMGYTLQ